MSEIQSALELTTAESSSFANVSSRDGQFSPVDTSSSSSATIRDGSAFATVSSQSGLPFHAWGGESTPSNEGSRTVQLAIKRLVDIALSLVGLLALSPFLLLVALAIMLSSPGPAIFSQTRLGLNGKPFKIYKFRTMKSSECDDTGVAQTVDGDTRVTALGRFLRGKSIDELPQLINVLKGDMSLVGPRPHVLGMFAGGIPYEDLVPYYTARLQVRPGITGWAQVNGFRGPTTDAQAAVARIHHDLAYVENFSLALDASILVKTVAVELVKGTGI